jgi:hypothetical protein
VAPLFHSAQIGIIAVALAAGIWVTYLASDLPLSPARSAWMTAAFLALWALLTFFPPERWLAAHRLVRGPYAALVELLLALASSFAGRVIAVAFKDKNLVAAGAAVAAAIDYWGVNFGTTKAIVTHAPALHRRVSVHIPHLGGSELLVGPGDYIFIGIMLALVHRFDMRPARTAWVMWFFLVLATIGVMVGGWWVPGIVPMAAAIILVNITEFKFKRSELFALLYVAGLLVPLALLWWLFHRGS